MLLLLPELPALLERRVLLFVAVDYLSALNEELGTCGNRLSVGCSGVNEGFAQRRHAFRVIDNERKVLALRLQVEGGKFVEKTRDSRLGRQRN